MKKICLIAALVAALSSRASLAEDVRKALVNESTPVPDCSLHVNIDRNGELPGYSTQWGEIRVCLPFTLTNQLLPAGATVQTFYIDEFSDARIRAK